MDLSTFAEILKVGGPVLAICIVLLWATLKDKERMAGQLNKLNEVLRTLVENNTRAMENLKTTLDQRPCLQKDK